jgi:hypothetical protein
LDPQQPLVAVVAVLTTQLHQLQFQMVQVAAEDIRRES